MRTGKTALAGMLVILAALAPATALAQVTFDDGPSSKEYAIPLDAARGQTGTKAPKAKTPQPAPQAPAATTPAAAPTQTTPAKKKQPKAKSTTSTTTTAAAGATTTPPATPPGADAAPVDTGSTTASSGGPSAALVIGALAIAVLGLGWLAGMLIRRRRATGETI